MKTRDPVTLREAAKETNYCPLFAKTRGGRIEGRAFRTEGQRIKKKIWYFARQIRQSRFEETRRASWHWVIGQLAHKVVSCNNLAVTRTGTWS